MGGLFICPNCGAATEVAAEYAGRTGPCAHCGRLVAIPADLAESASVTGQRRRPRRDRLAIVLAIAALLVVTGLGLLVLAGRIIAGIVTARLEQEQCAEQMRKIGIALESYYDDYSAYPPAVTRGPQGQPWHSWRVLLLPYLGEKEEALYKDYHLEEPWNGPHNRELADLMPHVYGCGCDPAAFESAQTSYLAIIDGTTGDFATPPEVAEGNPSPQAKLAKSRAKTKYLIVEMAESGVSWLEPRDLVLGTAFGKRQAAARFSYHVGGVNVLVPDGSTESMSEENAARAFGQPMK